MDRRFNMETLEMLDNKEVLRFCRTSRSILTNEPKANKQQRASLLEEVIKNSNTRKME